MSISVRTSVVCLVVILGAVGVQVDSTVAQQLGFSRFSRNAAQQTLVRPTVSPYLQLAYNGGLVNTSIGPAFPTYQTLVRPQLEAREQALASQQQFAQLQRQVNDIRSAAQGQQQNGLFATGHPTRFGIHSHFHPQLDAIQQQRR